MSSEVPLEGLSRQELEQRLAHALAIGDEDAVGAVEILLAACLLDAGDPGAARRHAERALAVLRARPPVAVEPDLARALEVFGRAARRDGDEGAATGAYLEAIDVAGRIGRREVVAGLLEELGAMAVSAGDRARARDLLAAALRTAPEPREDAARRAELGLARIELDEGDDASAARRALRVLHGGAAGDTALDGALLLVDAARVATARGDDETARRRCEMALPVVRGQGSAAALVGLLGVLALTCRRLVDLPAAAGCYEEAIEGCAGFDDPGEAVALRSGLLLELGEMCLVDMADPSSALAHLNAALVGCDEVGLVERSAEVTRRLHQAATALGDATGVRRWRLAQERASFVVALVRAASAFAADGRRVGDLPAAVYGDTGGRPVAVRLPGGRVSDGVIWRRRLAAEVRRAATRRRLGVLRGRTHARAADAPLQESLELVVVERNRVEVRVAEISRAAGGEVRFGPWLPAGDDSWPGDRDRLVEALREALA